jgi:fructose-bisphosphate aldolase class II
MLVAGSELLQRAVREGNAVGSFNTYNLEITRAIVAAAEACQAPLMLAVGSGALHYGGFGVLSALVLAAAHEARVPVAVHLDHSPDVETVRHCVAAGFTSLMIDGSTLPLAENIALTRAAVQAAPGLAVEGELGGVAGDEEASGAQHTDVPMTDPGQAQAFVRETGVASLAVAIGNAHGFYKGEPRLDFERLAAVRAAVPVPLVLHGASGIPDADLRRAIALGVRKINVNTETRYALFTALQASLREGVPGYDVTRLFGPAMAAMQASVEQKLRVFREGA